MKRKAATHHVPVAAHNNERHRGKFMKERMQSTIKRLLSIAAALVLVLGLVGVNVTPVKAEGGDTTQTVPYTPSEGKPAAGQGQITISNPTSNATYKVYKVFDATVENVPEGQSAQKVAYTAYTGDIPSELTHYFEKDSAGNVKAKDDAKDTNNNATAGLITALNNWVGKTVNKPTALIDATVSAGKTSLVFNNLPYGYYYVTSTVGSAVTLTSTNPKVTIQDKNGSPTVDKIITRVADADSSGTDSTRGSVFTTEGVEGKDKKAIAEAGSTVYFQSTIDTNTGATKYVYHDTMGQGLAFNTSSVTVKVGDTTYQPTQISGGTTTTNYTVATTDLSNGETFTISFDASFINKLGITAENKPSIVITYSAVVTSDALQNETENGKNTAKVTYGDNLSTAESSTQVYNAKISVLKKETSVDGSGLEGAGFILSRTSNNETRYYQISYPGNDNKPTVNWVPDKSQATEYFSKNDGKLYAKSGETLGDDEKAFTGLSNGTYKLIENTVPAGYNKAEDKEITINDANTTGAFESANLSKSETVVNIAGTLLPSTGGIGTTIFYIVGGVIIVGAIILLVARRKKRA